MAAQRPPKESITLKISVVGLGYVGTVAAAGLASSGHDVLGIDISSDRVRSCAAGEIPIYEPGLTELARAGIKSGNLRFSTVQDVAEHLGGIVIIAVGTPPAASGLADLSQIRESLDWISRRQLDDCVVVMKSTVPPGTGVELQRNLLSRSSLQYVSNPEFLREGLAVSDWFQPDRIVLGGDNSTFDSMRELYSGIDAPYVMTDITSAEMIKYAANAFLATKVSFINEIATICEMVGSNIDDVKEGISLDPRIGGSFLNAGVGYGGSCLPKDVMALGLVALAKGHDSELLRSVSMINARQRLTPLVALRKRFGDIKDVSIGVLGISFKPDTDDVRESPSIDLIRLLVEAGAKVRAFDPIAVTSAKVVLPEQVEFAKDPIACAKGCQALVLMTEWKEIVGAAWDKVAENMSSPRFLFDGRNALNPPDLSALGFEYNGIGRPGIPAGKIEATLGAKVD